MALEGHRDHSNKNRSAVCDILLVRVQAVGRFGHVQHKISIWYRKPTPCFAYAKGVRVRLACVAGIEPALMARFVRSEKRRYYGLPTPLALPFELHTHIRACLSRLSCVTTFRIATASDVTPAATARLSGLSTVLFRFAILGTWGRLSSRSCVALSALPTSDHRGFIDPAKGARRAAAGGGVRPRVYVTSRQSAHMVARLSGPSCVCSVSALSPRLSRLGRLSGCRASFPHCHR